MFRKAIIWALRAVGLLTRPEITARVMARHPSHDELTDDEVVVVQDGDFQKWACFNCPGGCGTKIMLTLVSRRSPHWNVEVDWQGRPTLWPSVRQTNDCRCHFWVRNGCVDWCADSGHDERTLNSATKPVTTEE